MRGKKMKDLKKVSQEYYLRQIVACWLVSCMLFVFPSQIARAEVVMTSNPAGTITVTPLGAGITQDMTATHGAIGNFSDFDIAAGHTVDCAMGVTDQALFRVNGNGTEIMGTFLADGGIWLIDQAGILIGNGAVVDVGGLVASSLNILDEDFTKGLTDGVFEFAGGGLGDVINEGKIRAAHIALIGRNVINRGAIVAKEGYAVLAAGDTVKITSDPDLSNVSVEVTMGAGWAPGDDIYQVRNEDGMIIAEGGDDGAAKVILAAGDIWSAALVKAYSEGGSDAVATVEIDAAGDVTVDGDGEIIAETSVASGDPEDDAISTIEITAGRDVTVTDGGEIEAEADAWYGSGDATATTTIIAGGDVLVEGEADIDATVDAGHNLGDATATVHIEAASVTVTDGGEIEAEAYKEYSSGNATANVDITTTGGVLVENGSQIDADAGIEHYYSGNATAGVDIDAGGEVSVMYGSEIEAEAWTEYPKYSESEEDPVSGGGDATATVDIDAGGDVLVSGGDIFAMAEVVTDDGYMEPVDGVDVQLPEQFRDALAEVTIVSDGAVSVDENSRDYTGYGSIYSEAKLTIEYHGSWGDGAFAVEADEPPVDPIYNVVMPGNATANVTINAKDDITVYGKSGYGQDYGEIYADAAVLYEMVCGPGQGVSLEVRPPLRGTPFSIEQGYTSDASAGVDLQSCKNIIIDGEVSANASIGNDGKMVLSSEEQVLGNTTADVIVKAYEDVIVNRGIAPDREPMDEEEEIPYRASGSIEAYASGGNENSAAITVLSTSDVIVNNKMYFEQGGNIEDPEIIAHASGGHTNNAFVGIATRDGVGEGDVIVNGQIKSFALGFPAKDETTTSNSDIEISAARDVIVNGGHVVYNYVDRGERFIGGIISTEENGQIAAGARGSSSNNANVEIYAGRDVTVEGATVEYVGGLPNRKNALAVDGGSYNGGQILASTGWTNQSENTSSIGIYAGGDVTVDGATVIGEPLEGINGYGGGEIAAGAHGDDSINTAEVVICAQADVTIDGEVSAQAGTGSGGEHYANVSIASGGEIAGSGRIIADADPDASIYLDSIVFRVTDLSNILFDGDTGDLIPEIEVGPVDCPECDFDWIDWTWCEDCEEELLPIPAPLAQYQEPMVEGCPVLTDAAAAELGITAETLQVGIGDALALNPNIQPCAACARLVNAAAILKDADGSRMAALIEAFNTMAPAGAPFAPEMETSLASAFKDAADGTQYASVREYIDAFVQYVTVLDVDLGAPAGDGDSMAFVMGKYGAGITGSGNSNIAEFIAGQAGGS